MAKLYPLLFFFFLLTARAEAQTPADSIPSPDTAAIRESTKDTAVRVIRHKPETRHINPDSLIRRHADSLKRGNALIYTDSLRFSNRHLKDQDFPSDWMTLLKSNSVLKNPGKAVRVREQQYEARSYDGLFYLLVGMLFFFAIVKLAFGKYLGNLLTLFFRVSMRQQQIREQVLQSPFPSLLLNLLFVLSGGLYAVFLLTYMHYCYPDEFWAYFVYAGLALAAIYLIKFIFLKIAGWIFNIQRTVETYILIVFMTIKVIGIFLLPFLVILSFSGPLVSGICITLSLVMIGIFFMYRLLASFKMLSKEIKITGLHFFLYLCAFEIAPLLLISKVLISYLGKAH